MYTFVIVTAKGCGPCQLTRTSGNFRSEPLAPEIAPHIHRWINYSGFSWDANGFWKLATATRTPIDYDGSMLSEDNEFGDSNSKIEGPSPIYFRIIELHTFGTHAKSIFESDEFTVFDVRYEPEVHVRRSRYLRREVNTLYFASDAATPTLRRNETYTETLARFIPRSLGNYMRSFPSYGATLDSEWNRALSEKEYIPYMRFMNYNTVESLLGWNIVASNATEKPIEFAASVVERGLAAPARSMSLSATMTNTIEETQDEFIGIYGMPV